MDDMARAAFLMTQAACMQAEMAAMQTQNAMDAHDGRPWTYAPSDFEALPDRYGLSHNAAIEYLRTY